MNKIHLLTLILLFKCCFFICAQVPVDSVAPVTIKTDLTIDSGKAVSDSGVQYSRYHVCLPIDVTVCGLAAAGALTGVYLLNQKKSSDENTILNLDPERDLIPINRPAIHNYDPGLENISNVFLYGSCVYGFVLLFDHDIRQDAAKIGLMYLETMLITGASYSLTAGNVNKLRPYAYDTDSIMVDGQKVPEAPLDARSSVHARSSFYAGHPSVPAAAGMFIASIYAAYHPHSPLRFVFYGAAVTTTAATAYLRYKGGNHFPTDIMIGVGLGTAYGLLIPKLHRINDKKRLNISPLTGRVNGINMQYTF